MLNYYKINDDYLTSAWCSCARKQIVRQDDVHLINADTADSDDELTSDLMANVPEHFNNTHAQTVLSSTNHR